MKDSIQVSENGGNLMSYNKITLYGEQTCDYIYIQTTAPEDGVFTEVNSEPEVWGDTTSLYANFNNKDGRLSAGNSAIIGSIQGYEIYRKKYDEAVAEYVGTIQKSDKNINDIMVDYSVKNGVEYTYYLFPNTDVTTSGSVISPVVTKQISIDVPYWSLFIVDETEEDNVFYLDKMFKFELNLQVDDMTNNTQVSVVQNFTKYPTIQYGASNYWSGSLSSLCGFIAANNVDYIESTNMIEELKSIASDTRRKFLKDISGNLWEVNVAAPINISIENIALQDVKTLTFSWIEVGDAKGVSIVNNPTKPTKDWVLTETGNAIPYYTYVWDEQYKWNKSYMWTANDNTKARIGNLGRNITE